MKNTKYVLAATLIVFGTSLFNQLSANESMAIMGDAGEASAELNNLKTSVQKENITSIIMPGDNLYSGTYKNVWNNWLSSGLKFDVVAIGNHNSGYKNEVDFFNMPAEYYSVIKNGARFIVLNSDNTNNVDEQFTWFKNAMSSAKETLIFVVFHHPTFTISSSHTWQEKRNFQLQMRDFLKLNPGKITALILGHDHMSQFLKFGDTPVVIAGSGREVRNEKAVSFIEDGFKIETKFLAPRTQHWGLLQISSNAQEAIITFIRVADQKRACSARFIHSQMTLEGDCLQ